MRIVSFRRDAKISYGLLEGDEIADLPGQDPQLPPALNDALPTLRGYVPPCGHPEDSQPVRCDLAARDTKSAEDHLHRCERCRSCSRDGEAPTRDATVFAKFANTLAVERRPYRAAISLGHA